MSSAATWMDLEIILLSEVGQKENDRYHYIWNLKYDTNEFIYKTEIDPQTQKTKLWLPKRKGKLLFSHSVMSDSL